MSYLAEKLDAAKDALDRMTERHDRECHEKWKRDHRWDELAGYNGRVSQGIVHTPEYVERMRQAQEDFQIERGAENAKAALRSAGFTLR